MKGNEFDNLLDDCVTSEDDYFEIRSMLPQQVMRILWDGFSNAIRYAESSHEYANVDIAARMYSDFIDATTDLPKLQAEYWVGRADDRLPTFWCIWMAWLDQGYDSNRSLN